MKEKVDLEFCFKGSRTYIQGPDIFDAVAAVISNEFKNIREIKYSAHEILHKNATMHITNKVIKADYPVINSLINFISDDIKYYAVVCENDKPVECSNDYSEEIVEKNSKIADNLIVFQNVLPDSYTEIVVSMNKYFLNQTVKETGKWIVTKFDYFDLVDITNIENKEIKIELLQNLNNKLTKSLLFLDEKPVGHLYFSLIPKES